MAKFKYIVSDQKGITRKGAILAPNEKDAATKLREEGNVVISVIEESKKREWFWEKPHLSFVEKIMFAKNMQTMMQVGITITEAMEIIRNQMKTQKNKKMFENIQGMLKSGQTLSKSLAKYGTVFSDIFINMVAIGEESGTLEKSFGYINIQLEKDYTLRKRVVSAFVYPAFIVSLTLSLTVGIVIFVLPKITKMFTSFDVVLPLPTRVMIGTSKFATTHPLWSILIVFGTTGLLWFLLTTKHLKNIRDKGILHIPIFGKLARDVNLARFARILNSLLQAGVPITKALEITADMLTSSPFKQVVIKARNMVEKGGALGESFEGYEKLFPDLLIKMLQIGEKTGSIETTTEHLATMYEDSVDNITKNLSVLLEPILLVFMGMLVGGVAISVIMPIYQLPNIIQSS